MSSPLPHPQPLVSVELHSVVCDDSRGRSILSDLALCGSPGTLDAFNVRILGRQTNSPGTACFVAVVGTEDGEVTAVADMEINDRLEVPSRAALARADAVVMDCNASEGVVKGVAQAVADAKGGQRVLWVEPTSPSKCHKAVAALPAALVLKANILEMQALAANVADEALELGQQLE